MSVRRKKSVSRRLAASIVSFCASVLVFLVILAVLYKEDCRVPVIELYGGDEITVEAGLPFEDPGAGAYTIGRLFGRIDINIPVATVGSVNTDVPGDYSITYTAALLGTLSRAQRIVHVEDRGAPQIQLQYKQGYSPTWLEGYAEEGYTAYDTADGDLTAQVRITRDGDRIVYTVKDSAGNETSAERTVSYSMGTPVIVLYGGSEMEIGVSAYFSDPGYSAYDSMGNSYDAYVRTEGEVIPSTVGQYTIRYYITNSSGETVEAVRTVNVVPNASSSSNGGGKLIYLTFDDGPGPYTGQLLDVLSKYGVKATFFVTANYPEYYNMIGRAYREGHSIGVHSYHHDYYEIYASVDAFMADFNEMEELIYSQTGQYTSIFRFPGGSSNTVSKFNPGIMTRLTEYMTDLGYRYFDWNVLSGDAGETTLTSKVISNVENGCAENNTNIVLQHDIKDFSVAAVENIIIWGLNNGYTFAALDTGSYGAHHGINN